jgi:hypothetical protein
MSAIASAQSPVKKLFPETTIFKENISYANDTINKHLLDIYLPPNSSPLPPLIIWVHGGAWMVNSKYSDMNYMKNTVKGFIEKGFALASIDYRYSTTKPFPAMVQDCNQAIQFLYDNASKYGYDKNRITLMDFQREHLAHSCALSANNNMNDFYNGKPATFKISSVIDFYGLRTFLLADTSSVKNATEPITILLGARAVDRPGLARRASPVTYIDKNDPPFLIIQGEKMLVPNIQSRYLDSWRTCGVPSKLIIVPMHRIWRNV